MCIFIRHKFLIALLLVWGLISFAGIGFTSNAIAGELSPEVTAADQALLEYINQARQNPLAMAEAVGLNKDEVLANFPDMKEILENGLPPLSLDARLHQTAAAHADDMLANNYYDFTSPDGMTYDQRIADAGYLAKAAGESLGVLFFKNYIPEDVAAFQLFANIYRDELRPDRETPGNILDPNFKDIGTRVYAGAFQFNGFSGNVYMVVCDFAAPYKMALFERQMLQLINQARSDVEAAADVYGRDLDAFLSVFPEYEYSLEEGLPPLAFNERLYAAAIDHALDMLTREYIDEISPDNTTPELRAEEKGYAPVWIAESRYRMPTYDEKVPPGETVGQLFQKIFALALRPTGDDQYRNIFAENPVEAGVRILSGKSPLLGGIVGDYVQLAVIEYGAEAAVKTSSLIGIVYVDKNNNRLYEPGEGVSGAKLTVENINDIPAEDAIAIDSITTDGAGGFSMAAEPGVYRVAVSVENQDEPLVRQIVMEAENHWLAFRLAPEPD